MATMLEIVQIPCLTDNYGYLLHDAEASLTAAIDTPDAEAIDAELRRRDWKLTHILNTHHHFDHVGGNRELKRRYGCTIVGPRADRDRIPGIDVSVGDGDLYEFGSRSAVVFDVPGHTRGHIAYWFESEGAAFVGDTLFSLGCGRLFEGSPEQMWRSLRKLSSLGDDVRVYCAHEYTQANARFALSVDPDNEALRRRCVEIDALRAAGRPTVPTTIGAERAANPFLRADDPALAARLGMAGADPAAVFAEIRRRKDNF